MQDKVDLRIPAGLDRKETELYRQLDPGRLPKHIAIIMDGNGRWAPLRDAAEASTMIVFSFGLVP
ncbi:MAG: hypothetical protein WA604_12510, partial [Candidatus Sulfotelmatobacter sp.]